MATRFENMDPQLLEKKIRRTYPISFVLIGLAWLLVLFNLFLSKDLHTQLVSLNAAMVAVGLDSRSDGIQNLEVSTWVLYGLLAFIALLFIFPIWVVRIPTSVVVLSAVGTLIYKDQFSAAMGMIVVVTILLSVPSMIYQAKWQQERLERKGTRGPGWQSTHE